MEFKVLYVDADKRSFKTENISNPNLLGIIDLGLKIHMDMKSYEADALSPKNPLVMGIGPFAGGAVIGSHRIVAVFKSPVSRGLHVSEMGGAAYSFYRTGLDAIVLTGYSSDPLLITVTGKEDGNVDISIEPIGTENLWKVYSGYKGLTGTKALTKYLVDSKRDLILKNKGRVIVIGPGAYRTRFAGIFSYVLDDRTAELTEVSDSASRGGGGSVMAQAHNVAAIIVGGKYRRPNPHLSDVKALNSLSNATFKKPYTAALMEKTVKYRFDPNMKTGGTFGVNYPHYKELVPTLNYNSVYLSRAVRLQVHDEVMNHYWKPFEDEVFDGGKLMPTTNKNCGEPCPVVCKKIYKGVKLDYEPAHGVGPFSGITDVDESAKLVDFLDNIGLDSIEAGHMIGWIFDLITRGLLRPEEVGLDEEPVMDPERLGPEASKRNARLARKVLELLVSDSPPKVLALIASHGLRVAAKELDSVFADRVAKAGLRFEDLMVYGAFGSDGYFTPNFYWSPGVVAPLYVLGKYWTDYSPSFREPEDYAQVALRRAVYEYAVANAGFCRFHRGWAEEMLGDLYKEMYGIDVDIYAHGLKIYKAIAEYQRLSKAEPMLWESRKVMDVVASIAVESGAKGWEDAMYHREKLVGWWNRFHAKLEEELAKVPAAEL